MSGGRRKSDREIAIERKWRDILLERPDAKDFQRAYDELHALFLEEQGGVGEIYGEVNPRKQDAGRQAVLRLVSQGHRVLELGCGDGMTSYLLAKAGNSVVSIDISQIALEHARARVTPNSTLDLRYEYGDARKLDFSDASFDFVISEHLIEHLPPQDIVQHFREVWRVLMPGGCYLALTPSRLAGGRQSVGFHLRVYVLEELCHLLEGVGFEVTWVEPKFLPKYGFMFQVRRPFLAGVFLYDRVMEALRLWTWPSAIKWRMMPTLMVSARKVEESNSLH